MMQVISIFGQPDNCTNACKEILQVMQQESTNNNRGFVVLTCQFQFHFVIVIMTHADGGRVTIVIG